MRPAASTLPRAPLAGRVRGAHGARGCQRPGRHLGRGRRLGLRRHLTSSGRREVTPSRVTTQPRRRSTRTPLPHRLDSTADETRDAADLSAGQHAEEAEEDERTQSRRTVGELVQFVRDSTCPGFTPESISPSLAPTTPNPLSNSARCGPAARHTSSLRWCTAELTANRRPEPTDVPSSPPASLLSWSHFPTFALLCTSTTWLRAVPPFL